MITTSLIPRTQENGLGMRLGNPLHKISLPPTLTHLQSPFLTLEQSQISWSRVSAATESHLSHELMIISERLERRQEGGMGAWKEGQEVREEGEGGGGREG